MLPGGSKAGQAGEILLDVDQSTCLSVFFQRAPISAVFFMANFMAIYYISSIYAASVYLSIKKH